MRIDTMKGLSSLVLQLCCSVALLNGGSAAVAGTIELPQTGQTQCYDMAGTLISCSGTGQDGAKMMGAPQPNPRFTANAGTSITDNVTGLIWTPNANLIPTRDPGWDNDGLANDGRVTWQHALDYVAKLNAENYLGHADWRLPNINELRSLVNSGYKEETCSGSPCVYLSDWLNIQGCSNVQSNYYWSSTTYAGEPDGAWVVSMWYGDVYDFGKTNYYYYVWPVRGGQSGLFGNLVISKTGQTTIDAVGDDGDLRAGAAWPNPRFTNNGNGTVTDVLTSLVWLKNATCADTVGGVANSGGGLTWGDALTWSNSLSSGACALSDGSHPGDWRLPNREELESLIDFAYGGLAISNTAGTGQLSHGDPFDNVQSSYYWSSTTYAQNTAYAWIVATYDGSVFGFSKSSNYYVWPVRGGQAGPFGNLTISKSDANAGTVTSTPAGINCGISYSTCSLEFPLNQVVRLSATPATGVSVFSGWSGDSCADGIVTMSADRFCTATFTLCNSGSIAITSSGSFGSINAAYVGAMLTDTIKVIASNRQEDLVFSGKNLTLQGGYDCAFTEPPTSFTTITGSLTISSGSVSIGGIWIQ